MPSKPPYVRRIFYPFVVVMLFFFIGSAVSLLYKSDSQSRIRKAGSWEQVKAYQYDKTPGLERAEKLKLTRNYNKQMNIPGTDKTLSFDEIWYNSQLIYFFYSVDMKSSRFSAVRVEDIPVVSFKVKNDQDEESAENIVFTQNWMMGEGVYYKNRYYGRLTASALTQSGGGIKREEVKQLEITDITVQIGGAAYQLPHVLLLGVDYKTSQEITETIPIDQSFKTLGHEIRLQRLELGTTVNRLYFRYSSPGEDDRFMSALMDIQTDKGERRSAFSTNLLPDGTIVAEFPPFNRRPENVDFVLQSLKFFNNEGRVSFSIDSSKFGEYVKSAEDSHREKVGRHIGREQNTDIYLKELYYDNRGIDFTVEYKNAQGLKKPYLRLSPEMVNSIYKEMDKEQQERLVKSTPMLMHITNELGEEARVGQQGAGGNQFDVFIDKAFVEHAKVIRITIDNLVTEVVADGKTSVSIPPGQ